MSNPKQTEEIVLSGYNTITWKDERLKWDTEKYDGYGVYQHMAHMIWEFWLVGFHPPIWKNMFLFDEHLITDLVRFELIQILFGLLVSFSTMLVMANLVQNSKSNLGWVSNWFSKSSHIIGLKMSDSLKNNLSVYSDGTVSWMPPALFRATCNIKVKLFPFDKQQCRLIFRSTDYDATLMDFRTRLNE